MSNVVPFAERKAHRARQNSIIKMVDGQPIELIDLDALPPEERSHYLSSPHGEGGVLKMTAASCGALPHDAASC